MSKYTPQRTKGDFQQGERGMAIVKVNREKGLANIAFRDGGTHTVKLSECPDTLQAGKWVVQMNGEEDCVFGFRPIAGQFEGRVTSFVSGEDEVPVPKTKHVSFTNQKGKKIKYDYDYFTVILTISSPAKHKGIEVPFTLRYKFGEAQDEEGESCVGIESGKYGDMLSEFLDLTGVWKMGKMAWKSNVLPAVEKRILHNKQFFGFIMKEGWVDSLFPLEASEESLQWEGE